MAIAERGSFKHLIGPFVVTASALLVIDHLAHFRVSDFLLLAMIIIMLFVRPVSRTQTQQFRRQSDP